MQGFCAFADSLGVLLVRKIRLYKRKKGKTVHTALLFILLYCAKSAVSFRDVTGINGRGVAGESGRNSQEVSGTYSASKA